MAKRQYGNIYPSVTQVLDVLRKIGLEMWFKMNTLEYINDKSSKGKAIGTEIHKAIEQFINTGKTDFETVYADEVGTALKSFVLFRQEHPEFELKLSEIALTSEKHKFNGTIDCPCPPVLIDWKTGEAKDKEKPPIYDEYKYQVAAYVYLWNENNEQKIETAFIVPFAKDKIAYNLYEMSKMEIDDCFREVFLPALRILYYKKLCKLTPNYYNKKENQ